MVAGIDRRLPAPPTPPGLEILPVTDDAGLADFVRIWTGACDPSAVSGLVRLRSATGYGPGATFEHLVGLLNGVPVACGAAFHGLGAGEVQHVVTAATARRRGIGTALTAAIMAAIRARGAASAVLTASPDGEGIYRELGFRPIGAIRRYRWEHH